MKNKYYTPDIEEFHVGFEYEVFEKGQIYDPNIMTFMPIETEDKFFKFTYPDPFYGYQLNKLFAQKDLRVKYLDQEDLESLGFSNTPKDYDKGLVSRNDLMRIIGNDVIKIQTYWIYSKDERLIRIFKGRKYVYPYQEVFRGIIKNKSELKRIMKQIQI